MNKANYLNILYLAIMDKEALFELSPKKSIFAAKFQKHIKKSFRI